MALQGDESWNVATGWRGKFGSETIPAVIFILLVDKEQKAFSVLAKIMNKKYTQKALVDIKASLHRDQQKEKVKVFGQGFGWVVFVGIMLSVFQVLMCSFTMHRKFSAG